MSADHAPTSPTVLPGQVRRRVGTPTDSPPAVESDHVHRVHARRWQVLAAGLLAAIFALDLLAPTAVAVPILYVLPTLVFVWSGGVREPLVVAAIATVLTVAGLFSAPGDADSMASVVNRLMAVGVVWVSAALVVQYLRYIERWSRRITAASRELQDSMQRLQDMQYALDQSAIVAATDQRGVITYVNDKFCEISQYSRDELLGQDHRIVNSAYHPKDFIRSIWTTIARGGVWRGELRNRRKDGSLYWVDTTIVPLLDARGKPWQYLAIRSDITQRKLAEQRLRDEAALTQLGRLSAVVAHEVRNPLAGIKGSLQILASRIAKDTPGREVIAAMLARIDALNSTVQDILTYARPTVPKLRMFDVLALAADAAAIARASVPGSPIRVGGDQAVVRADPEMCRAVLLNLLLNACHASGEQEVDVVTTVRDGWCDVEVRDRGPGIPDEVREQLFEPFVTTRAGGTGLGLAIARRLTEAQGGTLALTDRTGGGTLATLRLPLADAPSAAPSPDVPRSTF